MVIELDGRFVGQLTIGNIQHGGISDAWIGYWVSSAVTGRGIATAACALGVDHAFRRIGLHRLTATYLPSNPASGRCSDTAVSAQKAISLEICILMDNGWITILWHCWRMSIQ